MGEQLLSLSMDDDLADMYPEPDKMKKAADYTLRDIYENEPYAGKAEVSYEYDHGDSWRHTIYFMGKQNPMLRKAMQVPDEQQILCIGGEGHPCAEDCGGPGGWEDLKDIFKSARKRDPEGMRDWYKHTCANGDPKGLDPYKWDILDVNGAL